MKPEPLKGKTWLANRENVYSEIDIKSAVEWCKAMIDKNLRHGQGVPNKDLMKDDKSS